MSEAPRRSRLASARERMYYELVFESAEHVFASKGFEDSTMQDIATEAGISLKTLYSAFPGKNELYFDIQRVRGTEFYQQVAAATEAGEGALGKLAAGVTAYVDFLVNHEDFLRIHLREGRAWGLLPSDNRLPSWKEGVSMFTAVVREGIDAGVFHDGDPELLGMMGIAIMQVWIARIAESAESTDSAEIAEEILVHLHRLYGAA